LRQQYPDVGSISSARADQQSARWALFDVIRSVDRPKLAQAWRPDWRSRRGASPAYQVNTGEELQKAGILPDAADAIAHCRDELKLPVAGLMYPALDEEPSLYFAAGEIARRSNLNILSMGMSSDYEIAVRWRHPCPYRHRRLVRVRQRRRLRTRSPRSRRLSPAPGFPSDRRAQTQRSPRSAGNRHGRYGRTPLPNPGRTGSSL
jgi:hypothetical protein